MAFLVISFIFAKNYFMDETLKNFNNQIGIFKIETEIKLKRIEEFMEEINPKLFNKYKELIEKDINDDKELQRMYKN